MSIKKTIKTRSGLTSFYIVIFTALLFSIIAIGFVSLILSDSTQTINDQLSASARDSAMAGIEDAKLAIINCLSTNTNCGFINQNPAATDCNAVANALGRNFSELGGAIIEESSSGTASSEMLQAYTCVIVNNDLIDYRSYVSSSDVDSIRVVPLRASTTETSQITGVKISWFASSDSPTGDYNFKNVNGNQVQFGPISEGLSQPPTLSVQLLQTDYEFSLKSSEVDYSVGKQSDRGTLFLVPSNTTGTTHISNTATTNSLNGAIISPTEVNSGFVKANDKAKTNEPYIIKCDETGGQEFLCAATIQLPTPVQNANDRTSNTRNSTTSFLVISLPYGQPASDFAVQLCTDAEALCKTTTNFVNAQYSIDSTGRANDVYRRIETRVEVADTYFPYPQYAVHLTGTGDVLTKAFWATLGSGYNGCWYSNNSSNRTLCSVASGSLSSSDWYK